MTIPTSDLFGYWTLNETSTPCLDSVGGRSLTWQGGASSGTGKIGNGLVLDASGTLDFAMHQFTSNPPLSVSAVTVSAWVKVGELGRTQRHVVISYSSLYNRIFELEQLWSGTYNAFRSRFVSTAGTSYYSGGSNVPITATGGWWHIASRFKTTADGLYSDIHVNGTLGSTTAEVTGGSPINMKTALTNGIIGIGSGDNGTSYYSTATIDEVAIFNAYLTDAQILELYNSGNGFAYPFRTDNYGAFVEPFRKPFIGAFG